MTTQGTSVLNQLSSIERCANMGADCCAETKAAIARLEAKIDGMPRVDPAQIVKDAVKAVFSDPKWAFALGAIATLRGDNNKIIGQLNTLFRGQDSINGQLVEQRGLIGENTRRANSALNKANSLDGIIKYLTTDVADLFGRFGKIANSLASILGIVGSLAGLASLAGTIAVVFPRLDAHDRELDAQRQALSDNLSEAHKAINIARGADAKADKAQRQADNASNEANQAIREANSASAEANRAIREANEATDKANKAIKTADGANGNADLARRTADGATSNADLARRDAGTANDRASSAETKVDRLDKDFRPLEQEFWENIKPGVFVALTGLHGLINRLDKLYLDVYPTAGSLLPRINGLESDVARLKTAPTKTSSGIDQVARDEAARANRTAQSAIAAAGASASTAGVALTTSSTAVTIAQQALNRPIPSQNISFDPRAVRPVAIEAAKAEFDRRVREDFKFDPTVVKPVTIPEAQQLIQDTIQRDFKFDPAAVRPVAVATARAEVQQQLQSIQQQNQQQFNQIQSRVNIQDKVNEESNKKLDNIIKIFTPASNKIDKLAPSLERLPQQVRKVIETPLQQVKTNTSPSRLKAINKQTICEEAKPNGCIGLPLENLSNFFGDIGDLLNSSLPYLTSGNDQANGTLEEILARLNALEQRLNEQQEPTHPEINLDEILQKLNKLSDIVGVDEYPASLPSSLISTDEPAAENVSVANLTQLFGWYIQRSDEIWGQWEIPIEIKDSDPTTPGDQPTKIKLPNLAEAIAEIYLLLFQNSIDSQTLVNIATRTMLEAGQDKQQNYISYRLLQSLVDWAGYKVREDKDELPMLFNPGKTRFDELLVETKVTVPVVEFDEKHSLEADLMRFRKAASILDSVFYRKVNPFGDIKAELIKNLKDQLSLVNRINKNDDEAFERFINDVEIGFGNQPGINDPNNPYGRPYDQRPRIRDLTNYTPPQQ